MELNEYIEKRNKAREAAERDKQRAIEKASAESWEEDRRIDAALMEGVRNGETFGYFSGATGCPRSLEQRYNKLQAEYIRQNIGSSESEREKQFLKGFLGE